MTKDKNQNSVNAVKGTANSNVSGVSELTKFVTGAVAIVTIATAGMAVIVYMGRRH